MESYNSFFAWYICKVHIRLDKFHDFLTRKKKKKACTLCSCLQSERYEEKKRFCWFNLPALNDREKKNRGIYQYLTLPMVRLNTTMDTLSLIFYIFMTIFGQIWSSDFFFSPKAMHANTGAISQNSLVLVICQWSLN